jgi:hypothetical protein
VAFIKATGAIGGCDGVEAYLACGLYPLSANFGLGDITDGRTPVSKLKILLPKFRVVRSDEEGDIKFLTRVELEVENVVGSYSCPKPGACIKSLPNGGWLNRVFELPGDADGLRRRERLMPTVRLPTNARRCRLKRRVDR